VAIILQLLQFSIGQSSNSVEEPIDFEYWYGEEWMDYDDQLDVIWQYETWQLYLDEVRINELSSLPGMTYSRAFEILRDDMLKGGNDTLKTRQHLIIPEFFRIKPKGKLSSLLADDYELRAHIQIKPPVEDNDNYSERFEGSGLGLTQKYYIRRKQLRFGANIDKDRFEPSYTDLTRYWVAWKGHKTNIIAGYFHITTGHGLGLWTQPTLFDSYDAPGSYRRSGRGLVPSTDNIENSALRGIGINQRFGKFRAIFFASDTELDAVLDDSLKYAISLSNSGLHRTPGESEKKDNVREHCFGTSLSWALCPTPKSELVFEFSAYQSKYSPRFNPIPESRRRFPMSGRYFKAGSTSISYIGQSFALLCEGALDRDSNLGWLFGIGTSSGESGKFHTNLLFQHYPVEFKNPRAIPPSTSSSLFGKMSSAFLIRGIPSTGILSNWRGHIEIEMRSWRSFYIPVPHYKSKSSLELTFRSFLESKIILRFRRKTFEQSTGENGFVLPVTDNRLRITGDFSLETGYLRDLSLWIEGARQRIRYPQGVYSDISDNHFEIPTQFGGMAGLRFSIQFGETYSDFGSISYSGSIIGFKTDPGSVKMSIGDGYLPDRINSAQLSGLGLRWVSTLYWRRSSRNWITVKAARTHWRGDGNHSENLELYISISYYFKNCD